MTISHNHVFGFTPKAVVRHQTRKYFEIARNRLILTASILLLTLMSIIGKLCHLIIFSATQDDDFGFAQKALMKTRAEIVDMNGEPLASTIVTASLVANPQKIDNLKDASDRLQSAFPKLQQINLLEKLQNGKTFVWIMRHLTPKQQATFLKLGIPGLELVKDEKRIYPYGRLFAHTVGMTNIDNEGIAGIELAFDKSLISQKDPVQLSLDIRAQEIAHKELADGIAKYSADAGNVMIIHIPTGEIRAMVSCPDFNPSKPDVKNEKAMFNRNIVGVYEMGSTMKVINTAMSLSSGATTLQTRYDTAEPLKVGRFKITDFRGTNDWVTVPQAFINSSNIGASRMAIAAGIEKQKLFFEKIGLLEPITVELKEKGFPIYPRHWTEASLITISYGYGVSITPLHLATAVTTIINNGQRIKFTLLKNGNQNYVSKRIIDPKISKQMRALLRLAVTDGKVKQADVENYCVMGKTGTANRRQGKGYQKEFVDACFVGAIGPDLDNPEYMVLVMLENPKRLKETFGFNNAGWNAAPVGSKIMRRIAILYGIEPNREVRSEPYENSIMKLVSYQRPHS